MFLTFVTFLPLANDVGLMDPDLWRNGRYFLLFDVADLVLVIVGDDA